MSNSRGEVSRNKCDTDGQPRKYAVAAKPEILISPELTDKLKETVVLHIDEMMNIRAT